MERLRRLAERADRFARRHERGVDVALAVVIGVIALIVYVVEEPTGSQQEPDLFGGALIVVLTGLLAFRRARPLLVMVATVPSGFRKRSRSWIT